MQTTIHATNAQQHQNMLGQAGAGPTLFETLGIFLFFAKSARQPQNTIVWFSMA